MRELSQGCARRISKGTRTGSLLKVRRIVHSEIRTTERVETVTKIETGVWGYDIYHHSTGRLRYAVWDDADGEVCWCRTLERALEICKALGGIHG